MLLSFDHFFQSTRRDRRSPNIDVQNTVLGLITSLNADALTQVYGILKLDDAKVGCCFLKMVVRYIIPAEAENMKNQEKLFLRKF